MAAPTLALLKKAHKRLFFLRQLNKFRLPKSIQTRFYTTIIESIITQSIITWFPAAVAKDKAKLQRVIRTAERVIGKRARKIMEDPLHPGSALFQMLPSGRRLRLPRAVKSRHRLSFFPTAARLFNHSSNSL